MFLVRNFVVFFATFIFSLHLPVRAQTALDLQLEAERLLTERAQAHAGAFQASIEIHFKSAFADRVKDAPCADPQVQIPPKAKPYGQTSVYLFCPQSSWNISVPVLVALYADVPVATKNLRRGQTVATGDWTISRTDISSWTRGVAVSANDVAGQTLATNVRLGEPFPTNTSSNPNPSTNKTISAGDAIDIIIVGNGFKIQGRGVAVQSGQMGSSIRVRTESKNILTGTVTADGKVEVKILD